MRRFPPPWNVEALDAGLKIVDSNGQSIAYVYGHADPRDAETAKGLTLDEARRIASNIAKLPTLLGSMLPDDAVNNLSDERHAAEHDTEIRGQLPRYKLGVQNLDKGDRGEATGAFNLCCHCRFDGPRTCPSKP